MSDSIRLNRVRITVQHLCRSVRVTTPQIKQAVQAALGGAPASSISVVLVNDAVMGALHQRFMNDPSPTDVLTFDLRDGQAAAVDGEIVVSLDTAIRQAGQFKVEPVDEVLRYCIHGVLHLLGYDDHSAVERRKMRREEDRVLARLRPPGKVSPRRRAGPMKPGSAGKRA